VLWKEGALLPVNGVFVIPYGMHDPDRTNILKDAAMKKGLILP
jgi:hypothetical protein